MDARDVEVREFYNNYTPPRYVFKTVQRLLDTVPDKYVRGLECVVLTNQSGHPRHDRLGTVTARKRRHKQSTVLGRYHHKHRGKLAWVEIYVDNMMRDMGTLPGSWFPFVRNLAFGSTLFHEIGHHVHETMRPEFKEKEDVADNWSSKFCANFIRKKYRYLMPVRKLLAQLMKAYGRSLD